MKFTFGVLTYNQETLILETLESIKYQIITYGKSYNNQIIIIDDFSCDNTLKVCNRWIENNKDIFVKTYCIHNESNKGTVYSYNYIMNMIEDETFKIIAGDDLLSSENIYSETLQLREHLLLTYYRVYLKNGTVYYEEKDLINYFYQMRKNKTQMYNLRQMRKGGYLHTPSTLFLKQTYIDGKCKELNSQFRLFEDDPTWYSMIKNIKALDISFRGKCIVLYRIHEKSLSNFYDDSNPFVLELRKLRKLYVRESKGLEKIYLLSKSSKKIPKFMRIDKYCDKLLMLYRKIKLSRNKEFIKLKNEMNMIVKREQEFYDNIKNLV